MTNINARTRNYHGENNSFIEDVKSQFWVSETLAYFEELGLMYKVEEKGRVYPYSDTATSVLDVLRNAINEMGIEIKTDFEVKELKPLKNGYEIVSYTGQRAFCERAIVATGGKASPSLGSNGSGYNIATKLGHGITKLTPSLVQIKTEGDVAKELKGLKLQCSITSKNVTKDGELLFTEYGLSGVSVFEMSAYINTGDIIEIDIFPKHSKNDMLNIIKKRVEALGNTEMENFFVGMLNKRVGQVFLKSIGIEPLSKKVSALTQLEIENIAYSLKRWKFTVSGTMSWNNAQVTRGGIKTNEINSHTLESKKHKGLYFCGEILDIDGDCGGYNLQWAWSSGYVAGRESARK